MNRIGRTREQKTYELVLEYVFGGFFNRNLDLNDKLPNIRDISEKLEVKTEGIEEVFSIMEQNGLIRQIADDTYAICCDMDEYMHKAASIVMAVNHLHYSEILTLRNSYEKTAMDLAIQEITSSDLEHMKDILDGMSNTESVEKRAVLDVEFHKALVYAAHNRMLRFYFEMLSELQNLFIQSFHYEIFKDKENSERLVESHWDIYHALAERNYEKAWKALGVHFGIVGEYVDIVRRTEVDIR